MHEVKVAFWKVIGSIYQYQWLIRNFVDDEQNFKILTQIPIEYNYEIENIRKTIFTSILQNRASYGFNNTQWEQIKKVNSFQPGQTAAIPTVAEMNL